VVVPMSPRGLFRRYQVEIAFIFALLVLLVAGLSSYRTIESAKSSVGWVRHTYQVIGAIDGMLQSLALAHSSGRSFALTGDERYLKSNRIGAEGVASARVQLQTLTRDNAEQQQRMPDVGSLANRVLQRADTVIAGRRDYGAERSIELLRTGEGSRALEQFRTLAGELKDRERRLLELREQQANRDFIRTQYALGIATILALILTACAGAGTIRDIRARRKAEAELFLEKERAQVTLASIGDGVMRADVGGVVTFLNRAGTELTGWPENEAVGKSLGDVFRLIDASTRSPIVHRMHSALKQGGVVPLPETALLVRRDGVELPIEETVAAIRDKEGNLWRGQRIPRRQRGARSDPSSPPRGAPRSPYRIAEPHLAGRPHQPSDCGRRPLRQQDCGAVSRSRRFQVDQRYAGARRRRPSAPIRHGAANRQPTGLRHGEPHGWRRVRRSPPRGQST
jgi:PAS domain S-box-containing protein